MSAAEHVRQVAPLVWTALLLLVMPLVQCLPRAGAALQALKRFTSTPIRLGLYRSSILQLWTAAAITIVLAAWCGIDVIRVNTGADPSAGLFGTPPGRVLCWGLALAGIGVHAALAVHCASGAEARSWLRPMLAPYQWLMPVSRPERRAWVVLSLTAGICEELIYRGFALNALTAAGPGRPHLGPEAAIALASVSFGAMHLYQGLRRAWLPLVAGVVFSLLAILSGTVWLPIAVHAWCDLANLLIYQPTKDDPERASALIEGCTIPQPHTGA